MSHFTVGVICKNLKDWEKPLIPYQEYDGQDYLKEYLVFNSITEEEKKRYENQTVERFITAYGKVLYPWSSCFKVKITEDEYNELKEKKVEGLCSSWNRGEGNTYYKTDHSIIDGELKNAPYKEIYPTFEEYMKAENEDEFNEEANDYGYWENPNARWDWCDVGGRWTNCITLKNGDKRSYAKIKDINFGVVSSKYKKAERFWELVVEEQSLKEGEEKPFNWYKKEYYLDRYKDKNDYATKESSFMTFALLTPDGKWFEKDKMGFWGIDSSTKESTKQYEDVFNEVVKKEEYQDYWFVVVDCHI